MGEQLSLGTSTVYSHSIATAYTRVAMLTS